MQMFIDDYAKEVEHLIKRATRPMCTTTLRGPKPGRGKKVPLPAHQGRGWSLAEKGAKGRGARNFLIDEFFFKKQSDWPN